jgi:hypothetical protein
VFGRPRPRGLVDRPLVQIPPRKRRRITYDEDASDSTSDESLALEDQLRITSDEEGSRQLVLRADFDDDDEEDDEDFQPDQDSKDEDMDDLSDVDFQDDAAEVDTDASSASNDVDSELDTIDTEQDTEEKIRKLQEIFPEAPPSVCKHVLVGSDGDLAVAWETLNRGFKPSKSQRVIAATPSNQATLSLNKTRSGKASAINGKNVITKNIEEQFVEADGVNSAVIEDDDDRVLHYDQHGLPPGSISISGPSSTKKTKFEGSDRPASSIRRSNSATSSTKSVRFTNGTSQVQNMDEVMLGDSDDESDDENFGTASENEDSSEVSSEDSSSDSSSDSSEESDLDDKENTTSSDSESSSSDSDSGPEEMSSHAVTSSDGVKSPASKSTTTAEMKAPKKGPKTKQPTIAPGQGKRATHSRNVRRRKANELQRLKDKGIIPAGTTLTEFGKLDLSTINGPEDASKALLAIRASSSEITKVTEKAIAKAAQFEARRAELLASLASGGVEVGSEKVDLLVSSVDVDMVDATTPDAHDKEPTNLNAVERASEEIEANIPADSPLVDSVTSEPVSADLTPRMRKKLNLGAASRLLFGALGVRTPKTKADQEKTRVELMKHVRPVKVPLAPEPINKPEESDELGDPEAWREFITLRAVECCHDGIELTPAPFPFVQRWDPQQQQDYSLNGKRPGKGKRGKRNQPQYYDDQPSSSKKRKENNYHLYNDSYENYADLATGIGMQTEEDYAQDVEAFHSGEVEVQANNQLMSDAQNVFHTTSQAIDEEDLPPLPEDVSTLSDLYQSGIKVGMVIAFKQLVMSEDTNWQPQISEYLTAKVDKIFESGEIELTLAWRDRLSQKYYDEETGERIYGKFDMPVDDELDDADDGYVNVTFAELLDPKIVVMASEDDSVLPTEANPVKDTNGTEEINTSDHEGSEADYSQGSKAIKPITEYKADAEAPENPEIVIGEEVDSSPSIRGGELSPADASNLQFSVSPHAREEISELMRDAGFRSTVPSSVQRVLPDYAIENDEPSSPSIFKTPPQLPGSSPPLGAFQGAGIVEDVIDGAIEIQSNLSSVRYPQLHMPSSLASEVSDHGRQPDFSTPGDDTLERLEQTDSLAVGEPELPTSLSNAEHPDLPPSSINHSEQSEPPSSDCGLPTLDEVFSTARSQSVQLKQEFAASIARSEQIANFSMPKLWPTSEGEHVVTEKLSDSYNAAMDALDAALDEAEDPDQVTPKASQRTAMPQHLATIEEADSQDSLPRPHDSEVQHTSAEPFVKISNRATRSQTKPQASSQMTASQFVIPPGSQQVDLTVSSDVEPEAEKPNEKDREADELFDDWFGLPSGPGWVAKKRNEGHKQIRRASSANPRASVASSQTKAKAKSSRRKTTARF